MNRDYICQSPYVVSVDAAEGAIVMANLATGEVVELTAAEREQLQRGYDPHRAFKNVGILANDTINLQENIIARHREACRHPAVFNLTILPTLACDLACIYCFERGNKGIRMSDTIADRVVAFAEREAARHMRIEVAWFGGEPLLELRRIVSMHSRIQKAAKRVGSELSANITTNGHRLDEVAARCLNELGIRNIQVTIDGNRRIHNSNRPTRTGKGSFDRILENILLYLQIVVDGELVLRVNTRTNSIESILEVLPEFPRELRSRITVHLHYIMSEDCPGFSDDFAQKMRSVYREVRALGMRTSVDYYLDPCPSVYCYAERTTSAVVDPRGYIFKCAYTDYSEAEAIGVLLPDGGVERHGTFGHTWDELIAIEPEKCRNCEFLPICGFGCPRLRKTTANDLSCRNRFYCMPDTLMALSQ